jgi:hypothetical protein
LPRRLASAKGPNLPIAKQEVVKLHRVGGPRRPPKLDELICL